MGLKSAFKKLGKAIWQGYKIASPFLGFIPMKGKYGQKVGSGVYIYILESAGNKLIYKLAIVR